MKGFSLIEMLIVAAIIAIVLSGLMGYHKNGDESVEPVRRHDCQ